MTFKEDWSGKRDSYFAEEPQQYTVFARSAKSALKQRALEPKAVASQLVLASTCQNRSRLVCPAFTTAIAGAVHSFRCGGRSLEK